VSGRDPRHDVLFEPVRIGPKTLRNRATVAPRTYVALGVSGALPHLVGMAGSETVVAVNLDRRARIFEYADLGIAGGPAGSSTRCSRSANPPDGHARGVPA
jgi:hypothetical protein